MCCRRFPSYANPLTQVSRGQQNRPNPCRCSKRLLSSSFYFAATKPYFLKPCDISVIRRQCVEKLLFLGEVVYTDVPCTKPSRCPSRFQLSFSPRKFWEPGDRLFVQKPNYLAETQNSSDPRSIRLRQLGGVAYLCHSFPKWFLVGGILR